MKKLTAGIFTVLIGLCAANSADASVASTAWVEDQVEALATTVETNKTTAANATKAVSDALTEYQTSNDAAVALKAANADLQALQAKVGTVPEGSADVVAYINKKTEGIATSAALGELQTQVGSNTTAISTLNGSGEGSVAKTITDALASYTNTTDMQAAIKVVSDALGAHESTAASTYATKTALSDGLALKENVSNKANAITDDMDKEESYPTVKLMETQISSANNELGIEVAANTQAIATEEARAKGVESGLDSRLTAAEGKVTTLEGTVGNAEGGLVKDVAANADAITAINSELDTMATSATVTALTGRVTTAEGEIDALQGTVGDSTKGLVKAAADNAAAAAAAAKQASDNAALIAANSEAIEAEEARAKAAEQANAAAAKAADDKAVAAQATADAAIPAPDGDCSNPTNKCVLTYNNSAYAWEVIERSADGE